MSLGLPMRTLTGMGLMLVAALVLQPPAATGAFRGKSGKIAFSSDRNVAPLTQEIWLMGPDGSAQQRITFNWPAATVENSNPAWSPDGAKIAFDSTTVTGFDEMGNPIWTPLEIYVMDASGGGQTNLTNSDSDDLQPAWSPNGDKIVFVSDRDGTSSANFELYVMNADGSNVERLTTSTGSEVDPAWSPDGAKIAFTLNSDIYTINVDGSGLTNLTAGSSAVDLRPAWSPDGTKIAFDTGRDGNLEIYTTNSDGTGATNLTNDPANDTEAAWSPDGTKLAFTRFQPGPNPDIYVMNADGGSQTDLTPDAAREENPDWQPLPQRIEAPARADALEVALVPSFRPTIDQDQCLARGGAPSTHGLPLGFLSCNPPGFLPGTFAHLGPTALASAGVRAACSGCALPPPPDLLFNFAATDVRAGSASSQSDYAPIAAGPDVTVLGRWRLSDTYNATAGHPCAAGTVCTGTVVDLDFKVPADCAHTSEPDIGATCGVDTSANATVPGVVGPLKKMVVQLFRLRVNDTGNDGVRDNADDRTFATQGLFVP